MAVTIVLNNYFHDLATGVFVACAVVMWAIARRATDRPQDAAALEPLFRALQTALWVALAWIILGGIPRTIFFPRYEFAPAIDKGLVPALIAKHVLMFSGAGIGVTGWIKARRVFVSMSRD